MTLEGKAILVGSASKGIGAAITHAFEEDGVHVVALYGRDDSPVSQRKFGPAAT